MKQENEYNNEIKIRTLNGRKLTMRGNDLFFEGEQVTSEFYRFVDIPFSYHVSIRFTGYLTNPNNTKERKRFLDDLIYPLNRHLKANHPALKSGNSTVNYVSVTEFGASEDEVHMHVLIHIHPEVLELVENEVLQCLEELKPLPLRGMESICTTKVYDVAGVVSYFTKMEYGRDREFKEFVLSSGFLQKIIKFYT